MRHHDDRLELPELLKAGPLAEHLDDRASLWSNKTLSDGFIPTSKVRTLVDWHGVFLADEKGRPKPVDPMKLAERLVDARRWKRVDDGFQIVDYLDKQQSAEQILARRAKDSARKAKANPQRIPDGIHAESDEDAVAGSNGNPRRKEGRRKKDELQVVSG